MEDLVMIFLKNAEFVKSVFHSKDMVQDDKPIFVMVGKSNVGKSSFINSLTNRKKLAKVGCLPGKTRCINYYNIDNSFYLIDLPGYGYSKMSKEEKDNINKLTQKFLEINKNIAHIFFLIDIRHEPTQNDRDMYEWILSTHINFSIIASKADKLSALQREKAVDVIIKKLFAKEEIIPFSSESKLNLDLILDKFI